MGPTGLTPLEESFREYLRDYWPYLHGDPAFDCHNTRAALPVLPAPSVDRELLRRLIRFAVADRWGRSRHTDRAEACAFSCARYLEHFLPEHAGRSVLAGVVALDVTVALDVRGPGGGQWSCRWAGGQLVGVRCGLDEGAAVTYHTDAATFEAVVLGRRSPSEVFFARRLDITGDVEKGLKLAFLFTQFVQEFPDGAPPRRKATDADACPR
jgi:hypothetical protein